MSDIAALSKFSADAQVPDITKRYVKVTVGAEVYGWGAEIHLAITRG